MAWTPPAEGLDRAAMRRHLLSERERWATAAHANGTWQAAHDALAAHLHQVLAQLEPQLLGAYWPIRSEFNPRVAWQGDKTPVRVPIALPWARKSPREMEYRRWDGREPATHDECGIPSVEGAAVVPDVVLVPCVGYSPQGFRLGYGGGYFDRWLERHPHVTPVGVAWADSEVAFAPEPHDLPLMVIVTERGIVTPD
ncbi:5-formyltetrahydrofolate cyclo-ligase [Caldimonas thermodepolymerans]|jgi:5-formyltetrahydrofolate cyclo-ligase|uniref:5-formyltetrahydrofolate cyclo-ligase n=2 Tax=Caldimonas thermodepolymerans TaxID=215580 RepID=A0A2S5T0V5_9BURK|nr:5-formyltetrahydrofolate cyclo-ligase [Caldimonas thermodepolymerans]PPE68586.1 5-formyltetrahydrofolate cyclo-ligase [Caldimonas thermodepolymerans]QPC32013.1 5-formyltetrahydrofolate cyclo-ligase [Caldimonas thermodepolymerans]UZG48540.1 5-formyltetrahydrofolate cyclo-ligase [Caldimonas thermodepolymerans]